MRSNEERTFCPKCRAETQGALQLTNHLRNHEVSKAARMSGGGSNWYVPPAEVARRRAPISFAALLSLLSGRRGRAGGRARR